MSLSKHYFNNHYNLREKHAFLGASKYHWINYDSDKIAIAYKKELAKQRGTELHAIAADLISHHINLPKSKKTLNSYVNDAIGFGMSPEVVLYYSDNCFGTADAILFDKKKNKLRIHDLKTGEIPAHMEQLLIYTALFCLEYNVKPSEIDIELRIYQSDEVHVYIPEGDEIVPIMDKIITFDKIISNVKEEI